MNDYYIKEQFDLVYKTFSISTIGLLLLTFIIFFLNTILITELDSKIKDIEKNQTKANEYILNRMGD